MSEVYAVPGVYVTEFNGPSISIQNGETAIPVFLGFFTPKPPHETPATLMCVRVESWLDFTQQFGPSDHITVDATAKTIHTTSYMGAHSVRLYFENGGGPCYVLNIRREGAKDITQTVLGQITPAIEQCPDITLLCWCEFVNQKMDTAIYGELGKLLAASETSGGNPGRFLLTDAWPVGKPETPSEWTFTAPDVVEKTQVASYFPALLTGYVRDYRDYVAQPSSPGYEQLIKVENFSEADLKKLRDIKVVEASSTSIPLGTLRKKINSLTGNDKTAAQAILTPIDTLIQQQLPALPDKSDPVVLRASVAMAGVYARVDRERGVWKAPANVGLVGVTGLIAQGFANKETKWSDAIPVRVDDALNTKLVDAGINAVRAFSGQGIRVWGARTMSPPAQTAWRYVSVRRLFNTIERDARAALHTAVFEPNSSLTWERVRGALDNYLNALWRQGALQGETPAQAYFVHIGLGTTMTPKDITDGKMIVKVGVAAVRPAEFIILQLTQDVVAG
ncbi:phage tail sheath subtilisin-like domain-containing protein [Serratia marcescens]|uniref:phage tail sheath family protein n=1 Tax=Serratia TaxID=613 RepID=UPI002881B9B1|nr:phage tail sheath C-terminal domain-containing protein [Serratia marcescens]MDT0228783.1 phage tail sheath subtilisin-like domain-containing protein [Serratia marcescens]